MEKSADMVDVSQCTASTSLIKPRAERILNKHLKKDIPPPWGNSAVDNWRNRLRRKTSSFILSVVDRSLRKKPP